MRRKGNKQNKEQIIKYECNCISQERMIEIQAEAFYRALKKIEQEKADVEEPVQEKKSWFKSLLFMLNAMFFPWKISKRFKLVDQVYDSVLTLFVTEILWVGGLFIWLVGIVTVITNLYEIFFCGIVIKRLVLVIISTLAILLGSMFILAGNSFSKEQDSNKIYAYSACIIALVGCVASIIALFIKSN